METKINVVHKTYPDTYEGHVSMGVDIATVTTTHKSKGREVRLVKPLRKGDRIAQMLYVYWPNVPYCELLIWEFIRED